MPNSPSKLTADDLIPDARLQVASADAFRHQAIAARVADLAVGAGTPLNIALFGPWGSGKSSFFELLRTELEAGDMETRLVRYDAWKYGGAALKRNFLSVAAGELGFKKSRDSARDFHLGLYESKKSVHFDPKEFVKDGRWASFLWIVGTIVLLTLAAIAIGAAILSIGDRGFWDEASRLAPRYVSVGMAGLLAVGGAMKFLDGARIESEQSSPSEDEQFADLFGDLVERATSSNRPLVKTPERLIFFIDELDRCSKSDVVLTLSSLRTFLDHPKCVFIVAADREVLEEALDEIEQATPIREEEPYYSSASEFLDKIFQHQFSLPPLRSQRLTGFARELVQGRRGVWGALADAEPSSRRLNAVLYALIPAHVRSPRRVKVLLNNFATNARVSESRGIDWLGRATEIAKLTVLQTEFPRLAADLHLEPRLPKLLLDPPASPTERQTLLLDRHDLTTSPGTAPPVVETDTDEADAAGGYQPPDRLLVGRGNVALRNRQREDLQRYLRSRAAAGVPDPGRDLLYLEAAGEAAGLADSDLGQLLEEEAANDPQRVIAGLVGRTTDERVAAARVLGQMSEREAGPERTNMVTALAGVLEGVAPADISSRMGDLLQNISSYQAEEEVVPQQLPGLLTLAAAAGPSGRPLAEVILRRPELLSSPEQIRTMCDLLPYLDAHDASEIETAVGEHARSHPDILAKVVQEAEPDVVERLFARALDDIVDALTPTLPPAPEAPTTAVVVETVAEEVPEEVTLDEVLVPMTTLFDTLESRGDALASCEGTLMGVLLAADHPAYELIKAHAPAVLARVDASQTNRLALAGLASGAAEDWDFWASHLIESGEGSGQGDGLLAVLTKVGDASPHATASAQDVVTRIAMSGPLTAAAEDLVETVDGLLSRSEWWLSGPAATQRAVLHGVIRSARAIDAELGTRFDELLVGDMSRVNPAEVTWDDATADAVRCVAVSSSDATLAAAVTLVAIAPTDGALTPSTTIARIALAAEQRRRGGTFELVPAADVTAMAASGAAGADGTVAAWLTLGPDGGAVASVIAATGGRAHGPLANAVSSWARSTSDGHREAAFLTLLDDPTTDVEWLKAVDVSSDQSQSLAEEIATRVAATAGPARDRVVSAARALKPTSLRARRALIGAAVQLLTDQPNKSKSENAAHLVELVGGEYAQMKTVLKDAIESANSSGQMGDRPRKIFEGLDLLKRKKKFWQR